MKSTKCWLLTSLSLLVTLLPALGALTPEDYFHQGATNYVYEHRVEALQVTSNGLALFPDNQELKKLYELLNKEQQKDQQKDQDKQDQQEKNDQQKQDQQQQNQEQDQQKPEQQQDQQKQQEQEQQQNSANQQDEKKAGEESPQANQTAMVQMTPKEALKLLEATKGEEKMMPFHLQIRTNRPNRRILKNW